MKNIIFSTNAANKLDKLQIKETKNILKSINADVLILNSRSNKIESNKDLFIYKINKDYNIIYSHENDNIMIIDLEDRKEIEKKNKEEYDKILNSIIEQSIGQDVIENRKNRLFLFLIIFVFLTIVISFISMFNQDSIISRYLNIGLVLSCIITLITILLYWKKIKEKSA